MELLINKITCLESVCRVIPYRGFESRLLRQDKKAFKFNDLKAFFIWVGRKLGSKKCPVCPSVCEVAPAIQIAETQLM